MMRKLTDPKKMTDQEKLDELLERARSTDPDLRLFLVLAAIIIGALAYLGELPKYPGPESLPKLEWPK